MWCPSWFLFLNRLFGKSSSSVLFLFPGFSSAAVRLWRDVGVSEPASAVPRRSTAAMRPLALLPLQSDAPHGTVQFRITQPSTVPARSRPAQSSTVLQGSMSSSLIWTSLKIFVISITALVFYLFLTSVVGDLISSPPLTSFVRCIDGSLAECRVSRLFSSQSRSTVRAACHLEEREDTMLSHRLQ